MIDFKNLNFRSKLMLSYVLLVFVCLVFVLLLSLAVIGKNVGQLTSNNVENITRLGMQNINNELTGVVEVSNILYNNNVIKSILKLDHEISDVEFQQLGLNLRNELDNISFALTGNKIKIIYNDDAPFGGRSFEELQSASMFFRDPQLKVDEYRDDRLNFAYVLEDGKQYLVLTRTIFDVEDGKRIGKYAMYYDLENIAALLQEINIGQDGGLFIVNDDGQVIADRYDGKYFSNIAQENYFTTIKSTDGVFYGNHGFDRFLFCAQTEPLTGLKVVGYLPAAELASEQNHIMLIILIAFIGTVCLAILVSVRLSKTITRPVHALYVAMERIEEGDLDTYIDIGNYHDETAYLAIGFNKMVEKINQQMAEMKAQERSKRKSDLKILYEQINPHFLYNTLDSISWLATSSKEENREKVSEMVASLSSLLRLGLSKGRDKISVRDEIEHVRSYVSIQKIRFSDSFRVEYDIDGSILNKQVIKILLQPFVENAILHGFGDSEYDGYIKISGWAEDESLVFTVEDNGMGGNLDQIRAAIRTRPEDTGSRGGFGLYNIQERITLYYGPPWGIDVSESQLGGLCFIIRIPQETELT